jgi:hypothetical protein
MVETEHIGSIAELTGRLELNSIHSINQLPLVVKEKVYRKLIPDKLFSTFSIDPEFFNNLELEKVVDFITPRQASFAIIEMRRHMTDRDCLFFLEIADTPLARMEITFLIVNDPRAPRFDIDRDEEGRRTKFGMARRNLPEEVKAMEYGLAPGQVREGLGILSEFIHLLLGFFRQLKQEMILVEPLAYHNAIIFERYGFNYIHGQKKMDYINQEFKPGGELFRRLDGSSLFRQPGFEKTIRGRSWAIHDGILGEPWRDVEMYRAIDKPASVCTFPGAVF